MEYPRRPTPAVSPDRTEVRACVCVCRYMCESPRACVYVRVPVYGHLEVRLLTARKSLPGRGLLILHFYFDPQKEPAV